MKATTAITSAAALLACSQFAQAQTLSHLTFEEWDPGETLSSVSENGRTWFPFAAEGVPDPVASDLAPPPELRADDAPASMVSADFSAGLTYLEVEGNALSLPDTGWTIEAFVRFNAVGGFQTILGRDKNILEERTDFADFYFQKDNTDRFRIAYTVGFEDTDGDGVEEHIRPSLRTEERALIEDKWYHLAAVYDDAGDSLRLYINGQLEAEVTVEDNVIPITNPGTQFWSIGRGSYADGAADGLNGQIDDLRITAGALDPEDFLVAAAPTTGGCTADIDGDGDSDVQDLLGYLRAFRQGCD